MRRGCLRERQPLELGTEAGDLSLQLAGTKRVARSCECAALLRAEHARANDSLERGGCGVVAL